MIYKGNLKSLYVKGFQVTDKGIIASLGTILLQRDALFYKNFVGKVINFQYDTHLPSYSEAETFLRSSAKPGSIGLSCLYADYESIVPAPEETRSVKELKKEFKLQRKKKN